MTTSQESQPTDSTPALTQPTVSIDTLAHYLDALSVRTEVFRADPPRTLADYVNVRAPGHHQDRYPQDTIWAPLDFTNFGPELHDGLIKGKGKGKGKGNGHLWTWGPNFEFSAPPSTPALELAQRIFATLQDLPGR